MLQLAQIIRMDEIAGTQAEFCRSSPRRLLLFYVHFKLVDEQIRRIAIQV